jgi:hypothetical protein
MFVRKVSMRLKADSAGEFTRKMEADIIPLLRKQQGFLDEMTLIAQGGKEVYGKTAPTPKNTIKPALPRSPNFSPA